MKLFEVIALVFLISIVHGRPNCSKFIKPDEAWDEFKQTYNKSYPSECVEKIRKQIFVQNKSEADRINRHFCEGKSLTYRELSDTVDELGFK